MLWSVGINVPSELEQTRRVPLCGIGQYLREEVLEPFRLFVRVVKLIIPIR